MHLLLVQRLLGSVKTCLAALNEVRGLLLFVVLVSIRIDDPEIQRQFVHLNDQIHKSDPLVAIFFTGTRQQNHCLLSQIDLERSGELLGEACLFKRVRFHFEIRFVDCL